MTSISIPKIYLAAPKFSPQTQLIFQIVDLLKYVIESNQHVINIQQVYK